MADRRGVRSSSRRITPVPQLPLKTVSPPAGQTTRRMRSASRDFEGPVKPTRRSTRQASVESVRAGNEYSEKEAFGAKRKLKQAIGDLEVVEELHSQIVDEDAPKIQLQPSVEPTAPRRSLGAVSEMSGTTAISSFTFSESEALNDRFILRHLPKLHDESVEFLNHLTPEGSIMEDLYHRMKEMQNTESDFVLDFDDFNQQLSTRLAHYRGETQQYIQIRAIHAALFGMNRDSAAARTGLDLLLYQANLTIFAKDMIRMHRNDKNMVGMLRVLDDSFPALFLAALAPDADTAASIVGDSAMLQATFDLALELRTQLAIMYLLQGSASQGFDPVTALEDLFFDIDPDDGNGPIAVRGWNTSALGGDVALPTALAESVESRVAHIKRSFVNDEASEERTNSVQMGSLIEEFPWEATVLRLLEWVRDRNTELESSIQVYNGAAGISERVKAEKEHPTAFAETDQLIQKRSPRKSRTSFGRRRRSSKKFDPNAAIDTEVMNLIATKRQSDVSHSERAPGQGGPVEELHARTYEGEDEAIEDQPIIEDFSLSTDASHQQQEDVREKSTEVAGEERDDAADDVSFDASIDQGLTSARAAVVPDHARSTQNRDLLPLSGAGESTQPPPDTAPSGFSQAPSSSRPPQSTGDFVNAFKARQRGKENRAASLFDRQANAQRVDFGDGFEDSEPAPGPSTRQTEFGTLSKGKEPSRASPRKRRRSRSAHSDNDEDDFDTVSRSGNVERQRARASKRIRTDTASGEPTSHQPRPTEVDHSGFRDIDNFLSPENHEPSEAEAPDMTEEAPPRSTYRTQVALARANTAMTATRRARRVKRQWSVREEDALLGYMAQYPRQYSRILSVDKAGSAIFFEQDNGELVERRTQVDLKDKARIMAKNMIKSRAGLMPGFQEVITPAMATELRNAGLSW